MGTRCASIDIKEGLSQELFCDSPSCFKIIAFSEILWEYCYAPIGVL